MWLYRLPVLPVSHRSLCFSINISSLLTTGCCLRFVVDGFIVNPSNSKLCRTQRRWVPPPPSPSPSCSLRSRLHLGSLLSAGAARHCAASPSLLLSHSAPCPPIITQISECLCCGETGERVSNVVFYARCQNWPLSPLPLKEPARQP